MYYALTKESSWGETRTLEIHRGEVGWYFTIHVNSNLLFQSDEYEDRVKVTTSGISYLDKLHKIDYSLAETQRGSTDG